MSTFKGPVHKNQNILLLLFLVMFVRACSELWFCRIEGKSRVSSSSVILDLEKFFFLSYLIAGIWRKNEILVNWPFKCIIISCYESCLRHYHMIHRFIYFVSSLSSVWLSSWYKDRHCVAVKCLSCKCCCFFFCFSRMNHRIIVFCTKWCTCLRLKPWTSRF